MKFFRKKIITRKTDNKEEPYLIRWNIFSCRWFSIKIHKILLDDFDCLHDHPWSFRTFILKGGYYEHTPAKQILKDKKGDVLYKSSTGMNRKRLIKPFTTHYRPANWKHKLEMLKDKKGNPKPCYTLVIAGRRKQKWGFWKKDGFVHWSMYNSSDRCE